MGNVEPTPPAHTSPPAPLPTSPSVRRRDVLVGGVSGLAGLVAGAAAGRTVLAKAPPPVPEPPPPPPMGARTSYAQFGDDLVADSLFRGLSLDISTYLDIGAADPIEKNNTYYFYLEGRRGVLVEPDVEHTERLKTIRPEDKLLVAGVGISDATEAEFFLMSAPGLNTFDKEQAERLHRDTEFKIVKVIRLPLVNINRIIADHLGGKAPDLLSIDIEGLEYAVLKTLDLSRYRPKIIIADTLITGTIERHAETTQFLNEHNYEVRGMTFPNTFYVDRALLTKKK